ncbi:MAG: Lrp/AsnC ligand binding domain-containing protein [Nitrososphaerales archaeon]
MPISYVLINCDLGHEESIIKELEKISEVKEVRGVYGVFDIFAKIEADDMGLVRDVIAKIRRVDKVRTTNTLTAIVEQGGR